MKGARPRAATSSSDGSDRIHRSSTITTSPTIQRQQSDGSSSINNVGYRIVVGDYTLSKTLGGKGKVKLATHNVTGEKVLVTPSPLLHTWSYRLFFPSSSLLSRFYHAHTSHHLPQTSRPTPLKKRPRMLRRISAFFAELRSQRSSTIPGSAAYVN